MLIYQTLLTLAFHVSITHVTQSLMPLAHILRTAVAYGAAPCVTLAILRADLRTKRELGAASFVAAAA